MYSVKLSFKVLNSTVDADVVSHVINGLLGAMRMNGQICNKEWGITLSDTHCETIVLATDQDAFDLKYYNRYVRHYLEELTGAALGKMKIKFLGVDIDSADPCICIASTAYILHTNYLSLESPLRCADCYQPIPLYHLPPTYDSNEYYDIICWQSDYQSCDHLQMNCKVLERAATHAMSQIDSPLTKQGLEICNRIRTLTGKPVYYYLYRYSARSRKQELNRKCPSCNGDWLLDNPWNRFDFRCDTCHLVSNIAYNILS